MKIIYIIFAFVFIVYVLMTGKRQHRKRNAPKTIEIDDDKCARCQSCVAKCSHNVLEMTNDGGKKRVAIVHPELCTGCGDCMDVCRFGALKLVSRKYE
mgnify:CR=1 FL=1